MLDYFDDYTFSFNSSFEISFGTYSVQVACGSNFAAMKEMRGNGLCGKKIENPYAIKPSDLSYFTFKEDNVDITIFNKKTDKDVTKEFVVADKDRTDYNLSHYKLVDILIQVRKRAEKEEREEKLRTLEKEIEKLKIKLKS